MVAETVVVETEVTEVTTEKRDGAKTDADGTSSTPVVTNDSNDSHNSKITSAKTGNNTRCVHLINNNNRDRIVIILGGIVAEIFLLVIIYLISTDEGDDDSICCDDKYEDTITLDNGDTTDEDAYCEGPQYCGFTQWILIILCVSVMIAIPIVVACVICMSFRNPPHRPQNRPQNQPQNQPQNGLQNAPQNGPTNSN